MIMFSPVLLETRKGRHSITQNFSIDFVSLSRSSFFIVLGFHSSFLSSESFNLGILPIKVIEHTSNPAGC